MDWLILICMIGLCCYILLDNRHLTVSKFEISSRKIPASFSDFRIVQISDLHNVRFGKRNCRLVRKVLAAKPDVIVITGDLFYSRSRKRENALAFAGAICGCVPVYYVPGNHEAVMEDYPYLRDQLRSFGVTVLENASTWICREGSRICLTGIVDPMFYVEDDRFENSRVVRSILENVSPEHSVFAVLLSHRPELVSVYADTGFDLSLTGHAHGGQIRIPGMGGLYAPAQGFFPKYSAGVYEIRNHRMIVSRGLGRSVFPVRIFNPPEIVAVDLIPGK